jgi:hypothetical protein
METDVDTQLNAIDSMITEHVNAIIVIPADSRALVPPIKRALDAGIPVIDMLTPLDKKAMQDAGIEVGYFGPDDREATRMVGDGLPRSLVQVARLSFWKVHPALRTARIAGSASWTPSKTANSTSWTRVPHIGRRKKPTQSSRTCSRLIPTSRA